MDMHISGICDESSVDGQGLRMVVFTQGCRHNCAGCHNPETHDFKGGHVEQTEEIIDRFASNRLLRGITLSGGDPMEQPDAVLEISKAVKNMNKTVWVYTGYTYEELVNKKNNTINKILNTIDVLVDGKFEIDNKVVGLRYRGSSNQRVIDCKRTAKSGKIMQFIG